MNTITTAVLPVAGLGSRFLPATKASPKEMLPVLDRPLIQYVVDEAVAAGIKRLVFVTSYTKRAIEDYFDTNYELEARLEQANKQEALACVRSILPDDVSCIFIRQAEPKGLGHAVLCAEPAVGNQPFVVLLADDVLLDKQGAGHSLSCMIKQYHAVGGSVLAVETVDSQLTGQYGIVGLDDIDTANPVVKEIVEKPTPSCAPSNLGVIGRYVLSPDIFNWLRKQTSGAGGEIQLTDAIANLLAVEPVTAYRLQSKRFDCGNRRGLFEASLHFALRCPELRASLESIMAEQRACEVV